ncbi:hypothetical protein [Micromonospora sp. WMMB482]|uniref:hypothetical protein n=1 Tax=Micromonospora sp. WMMB482 TaxID=2849653 RepID=UPI0035B29358
MQTADPGLRRRYAEAAAAQRGAIAAELRAAGAAHLRLRTDRGLAAGHGAFRRRAAARRTRGTTR